MLQYCHMIYDLTIIGGGPAGVAAGVYAARKELKIGHADRNIAIPVHT